MQGNGWKEMPIMIPSFQQQVTGRILLLLLEIEKTTEYVGFEGMILTFYCKPCYLMRQEISVEMSGR